MADNPPNYTEMKPPDSVDPSNYSTHERRADLLRRIVDAGSPGRINQSELAEEYAVARSTVSRDMDRLRDTIDDQLGRDAKLTGKAVFEHVLGDLLEREDWKAKARAFDIMMEWNDFLADLGEQHREPRKSKLDVDMQSRRSEVSYQLVREGENEPLPTTAGDEEETVDYDALGFSAGPAKVPVETDIDEGGERDE